uniref:DNA-directed RNA polymerase subunit alpha n=1 Tax=Nitellopsis obtusa TaxID=40811 RepID=A0A8F6YEV6_9VIRI|nr:RNA polymerase alpha subunit [Nitellopsis obtusa]
MIQNTSDNKIQWKCLESKIESQRVYYGRFAIAPLKTGQANTLGITLRRTLLSDLDGICITSVKFDNIKHEYCTLIGVRESVQDILLNLKEIVFKGICEKIEKGFILVKGPKKITAADIQINPSIQIVDTNQIIAHLTEPVYLKAELTIEKSTGVRLQNETQIPEGFFSMDAIFMPIRNVNYSIHPIEKKGHWKNELLILEIWTNGSITPKEAFHQACKKLLKTFLSLSNLSDNKLEEKTTNHFIVQQKEKFIFNNIKELEKSTETTVRENLAWKQNPINQLELSARAYNCLKSEKISTIFDLLNYSQEDLLKIKNFGKRSCEQVINALEKYFDIELSRNSSQKFWEQLKNIELIKNSSIS